MIDLDDVDLSRLRATIETDKGSMVVQFFADKAPQHVKSFAKLAQDGFYDGLAFHRVVRNFMIQGGCPNTREGASGIPGTGGPGYNVPAEFNDEAHVRGVLSMARAQDPNSAGSQFFVVHAEHADFLDRQYTVFGKLVDGLDVLDEIASVEVEFGSGGEKSSPVERIGLTKVSLTVAEADADGSTDDAGDAPEGGEPEAGA